MSLERNSIACVGSGVIGLGWAALFASRGYPVDIFVRSESGIRRKKNEISRALELIHGESSTSKRKISGHVHFHASIAETVSNAHYIQESVTEDYTTKDKVIREIEASCPSNAIIASSSSGLLISKIQRTMKKPERSLIVHPFHPVYLIPLVEIVPGRKTTQAALNETRNFMEKIGKKPIVLKKELPGHVANRLQAVIWREAINIVSKGVVSFDDIDTSLLYGPGLRWAFIGPMTLLALAGGEGGFAHVLSHIGPTWSLWWKSMANWSSIPAKSKKEMIKKFDQTSVEYKKKLARARDEMLLDLLRLRESNNAFNWYLRSKSGSKQR